MGIENDGDDGIFFDEADFGVAVIVHPEGAIPFEIVGIYNAPYLGVAEIDRVEADAVEPTLRCAAADVEGVKSKDHVEIRGERLRIKSIEPDRDGRHVLLRLRK